MADRAPELRAADGGPKADPARRGFLPLVGGVVLATAAGLAGFALFSGASRFLNSPADSSWIVYPVPPSSVSRPATEQTAVFERSFSLDAPPEVASITIRAFQHCRLTVNSVPVELLRPAGGGWREPLSGDVSGWLRPGTNSIAVTVSNDIGPPALWLRLTTGGKSLTTDSGWDVTLNGAVKRPARLASVPAELRNGNPLADAESPVASLRARWPSLLLFAALAAAVVAALHFGRDQLSVEAINGRAWRLGLLGVALAWLALWGNNARSLVFPVGFDAKEHLEYICFVREHGGDLPLACDGWEMHQPPLYYLASAALFGLGELTLRAFSLLLGITHVALIILCLRLLFPGAARAQVAGAALAAFLPAHLYLFHFVTNETLTATLGTASVYFCIRVLREPHPSSRLHAILGLVLGAALLTKLTALLLVGVILAVLAARLVARRDWSPGAWLRLGLTVCICFAVSGWHYGRVWSRFGTPLVGNYDESSGFRWWQDPGYCTASSLLGFGRVFVRPFFSALNSLPDGLYSTLWGDGLCSGFNSRLNGPPWNYDLMAAGYLLALVPTALILIGTVAAIVRFIRRPDVEWFLLIGLAFALGVAFLYQYLRYPYSGHAKAIYGLIVVVAFCAFGGWGFELLCRRSYLLGVIVAVALGTWALTAYASFWVRNGAAQTQTWLGNQWLTREGGLTSARECFKEALQDDPHAVQARLGLVKVDHLLGRVKAAHGSPSIAPDEELEQALREAPKNPEANYLLAEAYWLRGDRDAALRQLRRVVELAPDHPLAYQMMALLLNQQGKTNQALAAYRAALGITPYDPKFRQEFERVLASPQK